MLRARLKTLGVVEHHFALDRGTEKGVDWRICEYLLSCVLLKI